MANQHCTKYEVFQLGFLESMLPNPQESADLFTFTEEILNGKLYFLHSANTELQALKNYI